VSVVRCAGRGIARNVNLGLRTARHDLVLVTHDDCTVAQDWVAAALRHLDATPEALVTGRVMPGGDPRAIPSIKTNPRPRYFTGAPHYGVLYPNNMALNRHAALALGGFDEQSGLWTAGEDLDFCYRWLQARRPLRYEPDMVVWHHDWRTPEELLRTYGAYARAAGVFCAKHARWGSLRAPLGRRRHPGGCSCVRRRGAPPTSSLGERAPGLALGRADRPGGRVARGAPAGPTAPVRWLTSQDLTDPDGWRGCGPGRPSSRATNRPSGSASAAPARVLAATAR
jgi:glycosyl transferase family 2